jgi:hypothetical protein
MSAYGAMVQHADTLRRAVKQRTGVDMQVTHVAPEHAAAGFASATFSFNLPSPAGAAHEVTEALAQRFVDLLTEDAVHFKPCVSFGQDNGLVYCTVPATSTQGALKAEDKAKQAKGGVQLTRLSFPPTSSSHRSGSEGELSAVAARIEHACKVIYG